MADVTINSGTDADVAFRLYVSLINSGRASAPKKEQALALFRECMEAVQHKAPIQMGSMDLYGDDDL